MNWFQQNRFLGTFLAVLGAATLACALFLWMVRSRFADAKVQFDQHATELAALQRHNPFPTEVNLRKMKTQAEEYASQLTGLKEELKTRVLPVPAEMKPNEFQARLRQAMTSVAEKARANKVKLPDNFFLGFDEFSAALPETAAAPVLGQQLAQVELLMNIVIDARVAEVTSLTRTPPGSTAAPGATATPAVGRKPGIPVAAAAPLVERTAIDVVFTGPPSAARRVLNQISTVSQQLYIIRTLHVLNEKEKGPPRDSAGAGGGSSAPTGTAPGVPAAAGNTALNFIVGNEKVRVSARIEMVRFAF